jgi:hypothetical protein
MIKIIDIAETLCDKLSINEEVQKFKISINLNFSLNVNVVSDTLTKEAFDEQYLKGWERYNIECEVYSSQEAEGEYVQPIFAGGNGIDYGQRFRLTSLFDSKKKNINIVNRDALPPIITFYSYKGGMGRTTSMVSYAINLALQGKKVFIIDADLEAPGYINFFELPEHAGLKAGMINGLVEYLSDLEFTNDGADGELAPDLQDYCLNVVDGNHAAGLDPRLSNIYMMPAGNLNEVMQDEEQPTCSVANKHLRAYMEGLSRINLGNIRTFMRDFNKLLIQVKDTFDPDVVLIDSRTGFNDVMGTVTMFFSDMIVGFFGSNEQTVPGLKKLLQSYQESDFKLMLVNSILPDNPERADEYFKRLNEHIDDFYRYQDVVQGRPLPYRLHRLPLLEQLGIDKNTDKAYLDLIEKRLSSDYNMIFDQIDLMIQDILQEGKAEFKQNHSKNISISQNKKKKDPKKMGSWSIRNFILRGLKREMEEITDFAEDQDMKPRVFFYRYCMNEFFDDDKFLILGYKGTGKTYLYLALAETSDTNEEIAKVMLKRANKYRSIKHMQNLPEDVGHFKFIDIISATSEGTKRLAFDEIDYGAIENPQLYFKRLWQVHTWLSILQDPDFDEIKRQSELFAQNLIVDDLRGSIGLKAINDIIKMGVDAFIAIEEDLRKINRWCVEHDKRLFLLYDQLDTRINPRYWDIAVSPLINYWRENCNMHSNLFPKIFVRTDLFQRIGGTNTARLKNNIVSIEWSIDEIFGYIVKLIVCDPSRKESFMEMLKRVYKGRDAMIADYEKQFNENDNQLIRPNISSLANLIRIIFGKEVTSLRSGARITPYDYFFKNLANADGRTYSLRPFITTLDRNAIERSLARIIPNRYVQWLIAPEDYANREVRTLAAQQYFDDLTREEFSKDLIKFRDVLQSDKGKPYRRKTLREIEFNALINLVMDSYSDFIAAKTGEDLKLMLYASGIVAEHPISGEKIYRFAPLYFYHWGLKSTRYEKEKDRVFFEDDTDE